MILLTDYEHMLMDLKKALAQTKSLKPVYRLCPWNHHNYKSVLSANAMLLVLNDHEIYVKAKII